MTSRQPPPIPTKRYLAIGEASALCDVKPHVLRYWEQEFAGLQPVKRNGNRRYYRHQDIFLIHQIRSLLYDQGYTIEGARQQLAGKNGPRDVIRSRLLIRQTIADLQDVLCTLKA